LLLPRITAGRIGLILFDAEFRPAEDVVTAPDNDPIGSLNTSASKNKKKKKKTAASMSAEELMIHEAWAELE
jgi:hypothetical protein